MEILAELVGFVDWSGVLLGVSTFRASNCKFPLATFGMDRQLIGLEHGNEKNMRFFNYANPLPKPEAHIPT